MLASVASPPAADKVAYKSPKHAQVWFLRRSRDLWKNKHHALKVQAKRLQNRVADVCNSRDHWRARATQAQLQLTQLQLQLAQLSSGNTSPGQKKGPT